MIAPFSMLIHILRKRLFYISFFRKNAIKKVGKGCNINLCVLVYKYRY